MPSTNKDNKQLLLQYAGMGTQFLVAIGVTVWGGMKLDQLFTFSTPILVWLLPLVTIIALFIKVARDTSKRN